MIFLLLFITFFQIGLFGFGGGYAMLSMIQGEVVTRYHWLSTGEFTDIVAISQMTPGPIGINSATYVGYTAVVNAGYSPAIGVLGSLVATFAVVLPSLVLMILISKFLMQFKNHPAVEHMFQGLRPAVVGLLAAACLLLMTAENFSAPTESYWQFGISIAIFVFSLIACQVYKLNPIRVIICAAVVGILLL
ncbi:MAG: chromate transporter [Bacteroidaceae bacterium]|nr:chromate transporter [Bacteroidaceae bacterium]